jgi:hypothetical protein
VVEAGIVELKAAGVLEVDPAPHRLGSVTAGQVKQELQHGSGRSIDTDDDSWPTGIAAVDRPE